MGHLPECPDSDDDWLANWWDAIPCICGRLRACEQRVLDAAEAAVAEQKLIPLAKQGRFIITRNTKLWDQRQAWSELGWWDFRKSVLSAIRALKEQR